jgi:hypothetical protein
MARKFSLWLVLTAMLPLTTASAANTGFYIGAGAGGFRMDADWGEGSGELPVGPLTPSPGAADAPIAGNSTSGTAIGFQAFAGWRIFSFLAIEAGYLDLGKVTDQACFTFTDAEAAGLDGVEGGDCKDQEWDTTVETTGWQLSILGILPINDTWEIFGRLGALKWDTDYSGIDRVSDGLFNRPGRCPDPPGSADPNCVTRITIPQPGAGPLVLNRGPDNRSGSMDGTEPTRMAPPSRVLEFKNRPVLFGP